VPRVSLIPPYESVKVTIPLVRGSPAEVTDAERENTELLAPLSGVIDKSVVGVCADALAVTVANKQIKAEIDNELRRNDTSDLIRAVLKKINKGQPRRR
jgi:hypothetical protein